MNAVIMQKKAMFHGPTMTLAPQLPGQRKLPCNSVITPQDEIEVRRAYDFPREVLQKLEADA